MSWRLSAGNETEVMDARGRNVARAHCGGPYGVKLDEAEANARLIAAAPDMLAVLEWVADQDDIMLQLQRVVDEYGDHICGNIRAAIARAKGDA